MGTSTTDGSAGDADHGEIGGACSRCRRPDPRLAALLLGSAQRLDLDSGARDTAHGAVRMRSEREGSLALVVPEP